METFLTIVLAILLADLVIRVSTYIKYQEKSKNITNTLYPVFSEFEIVKRGLEIKELYKKIQEQDVVFEEMIEKENSKGEKFSPSRELLNHAQTWSNNHVEYKWAVKELDFMNEANIAVLNGKSTVEKMEDKHTSFYFLCSKMHEEQKKCFEKWKKDWVIK